jgi:DNA-directed RNA polymerase subunit beta'
MNKSNYGRDISDFDAVKLSVASADDVLEWSHGEVTKPETINYRTQKPERDGLFCEKIFGPVKDINPHDAKLKGVRYREMAIDKKGEIVTKSIVRRERMGHISLAAPVAHIWFMRGTPSAMGLLLGMTVKNLERVAYFASYIIKSVDEDKRRLLLNDLEAESEAAKLAIKTRFEKEAEQDNANIKALAEAQTRELEEAMQVYVDKKAQLDSLVKNNLISEADYRELDETYSNIIKVGMGGLALKELLDEINLTELIEHLNEESVTAKGQRKRKLIKRLKVLEGMHQAGIKPSSMVVTVLPVIPPDLRPMVQLTGGRFATSDLNDLYRRVINRNNRLKKLIDLKAPEVIRRNEMRMLQEAVDALIDNNAARGGRAVSSTGGRRRLKSLSDMLKGKQGRFRQNLLGKRVDYSGRSVIVSGPDLKIFECGLPKMMALELFKPFVIGNLIDNELAHNIKSATRMIEAGETPVWDALDAVTKGKYVLLNRAPSLHRLSIQAFQPRLIEGKAIQLHPLVCKGFNADFDGDQMAVHVPLGDEAQKEAREIMVASRNLLKPADGSPILHIEQDIVLGAYYMTYNPKDANKDVKPVGSINEAIFAYDDGYLKLQDPIRIPFRGEIYNTTLGRVLFNEIFPEDFKFQNSIMTKKQIQSVMTDIYQQYGQEETARIADDLKDISFKYATISGLSMGMSDFSEVKGIEKILEIAELKARKISEQYEQGLINEDERYRLTVRTWMDADDEVQEKVSSQFASEDTSMAAMVISGARGSIGQVKMVTGSVGVQADATGRAIELPVKSNYRLGLSPLEYFTATRGARKGLIDTALKTADSGYLTRRLVDVSQDVFTTDEQVDDPGFAYFRADAKEVGIEFGDRLVGRVLASRIRDDDGKVIASKGTLITPEIAQAIDGSTIDEVTIKSVLSCLDERGVAPESYGVDLATGEMVKNYQPIGVIAAQSIGEPGTQLTLKTFHAGGTAGDDITTGLPRVEELFEARQPKGQAFLSEIEGTVTIWEEGELYIVQVLSDDTKTTHIKLKGATPVIKSGTELAKGDVIAKKGDDDKKTLIATVSGVAEVFKDEIVIASTGGSLIRYEIPSFKQLTVADGDRVEKGGRLTSGSINLQELMSLKGIAETQRYIINEVLRIFVAQGQTIADKHLEIVVRQMFSRVQIEDSGASSFVTGDIVSKAAVIEENVRLSEAKKELIDYNQLLLGITKVSTWSDSFLAAASFQDTTRVLINAAIAGRVDKLYGLKENVIIGRRIPVGTGVKQRLTEDE